MLKAPQPAMVEPGFDSKTCDFSKSIFNEAKHSIHTEKCGHFMNTGSPFGVMEMSQKEIDGRWHNILSVLSAAELHI